MNRLWAFGAVVVLGMGLALSPVLAAQIGSPTGAPAGRSVANGVKTVNIAGKRVVVNVSASRNFGFLSDPRGRLQTSVYLTTADGSGLPGITSVKVSLTQGKTRWTPVLSALPDDVQSTQYYVAQGGPVWQVNSRAMAQVEMRVGQSTYRVEVPLTVYARRDLIPVAG